MKTLLTLVTAVLTLACSAAAKQPANGPLPKYIINKTEQPIKIDGKLDDPAWRHAQPSPVFAEIETGCPARYPVQARMLWNDKYLYIAFNVNDPNVWAQNLVRDVPMAGKQTRHVCMINKNNSNWGKYRENAVKVYLEPDNDCRNYCEIHVSPLNTVCDKLQNLPWSASTRIRIGAKANSKVIKNVEWNCPGMKTATQVQGTFNDPYDTDEGWTVEMAIPFTALKSLSKTASFPPKTGDTWRVHLARTYAASLGAKLSCWGWPVLGQPSSHTTDRWGYAVFADVKNGIDKKFANLPKGKFNWKALWAYRVKDAKDAQRLVTTAKKINCNVLIVSTNTTNGYIAYQSKYLPLLKKTEPNALKTLISLAHKNNLQVYAWYINLRPSNAYAEKHPELLQKMRSWEMINGRLPRITPDRLNFHRRGHWLDPSVGLTDYERDIITEMLTKFDFDGLALDYVGYRNFQASFSDYANKKRQEFADKHPELTNMQVLTQFSENALINYCVEVRKLAKKIRKNIKLAAHVYPDFDLNKTYASKLPIEYCGQTIAWFFKPFWSLNKVYDVCMMYKNTPKGQFKFNNFVPFVRISPGKNIKSKERVRKEIRIAGLVGNGTIMLAFDDAFWKHPELAKVVAEEFSDTK
ncbi:sugar-binding protein [Lentisphaerota bacterium ZTH]|nr:family 10 glycosylhydrolase [Lentisphaerota bacterium]WET05548.1 sugar-binding protein [Lentisphaerota bacterium ZTH]